MIRCKTENGVEYITKIEHFRDLVSENVYQALIEFLQIEYGSKINDLEAELGSYQEEYDLLKEEFDDLENRCRESDDAYEELEEKINKLQEFYDSIKEICNNSDIK